MSLTIGTENITQIFDAVHDNYIKALFEQYKSQVILFDKLKRKPADGRQTLYKAKLGSNRSGVFLAERGTMPSAKGRIFEEMTVLLKYMYVAFDMTGPELKLCKSKEQIVDVIGDAFKDTFDAGKQFYNRTLWLDGSQRIAQCNGTGSYDATTEETTVTFDNGCPFHFHLHESLTFGTNGTGYELVSIDRENSTIDVVGDCSSVAVNDAWIYPYGGYVAGYARAPMGLKGHNSDSDPPAAAYQGFNRATSGYDFLQAHVEDFSGTALTTVNLDQFFFDIHARAIDKSPNLILTEDGVLSSFKQLMSSKHQSVDAVPSKIGYGKQLSWVYNGEDMTLVSVLNCPSGELHAINTDYLEILEGRPLEWDTMFSSSGKLHWDNQADIFYGRLVSYWNTICYNNSTMGKMEDVKRYSIT